MSTSKKDDPKFLRAYDRGMLRSAFRSLFWAIISDRKKRGGFTLLQLAKTIGANKAEVTRWFKGDPNWTLNTVAELNVSAAHWTFSACGMCFEINASTAEQPAIIESIDLSRSKMTSLA
jgi:hypothetical protein